MNSSIKTWLGACQVNERYFYSDTGFHMLYQLHLLLELVSWRCAQKVCSPFSWPLHSSARFEDTWTLFSYVSGRLNYNPRKIFLNPKLLFSRKYLYVYFFLFFSKKLFKILTAGLSDKKVAATCLFNSFKHFGVFSNYAELFQVFLFLFLLTDGP